MANFLTAFGITNRNEGGYANNSDDSGGMTYAGISRNNWPDWAGWPFVDRALASNDIASLRGDGAFWTLIQQFYKQNFWDVNKLDSFTSQAIANTVYDFGVNSGTGKAAKTLQQILELNQDGIIGQITLGAVNGCDFEATYNAYNYNRRQFYEILAERPGQKQFLNSWLSRLVPYQS